MRHLTAKATYGVLMCSCYTSWCDPSTSMDTSKSIQTSDIIHALTHMRSPVYQRRLSATVPQVCRLVKCITGCCTERRMQSSRKASKLITCQRSDPSTHTAVPTAETCWVHGRYDTRHEFRSLVLGTGGQGFSTNLTVTLRQACWQGGLAKTRAGSTLHAAAMTGESNSSVQDSGT